MSRFKEYTVPWFLEKEIGRELEDVEFQRLRKALPILKPRSKTLVEMAKNAWWVLNRPDCWKKL